MYVYPSDRKISETSNKEISRGLDGDCGGISGEDGVAGTKASLVECLEPFLAVFVSPLFFLAGGGCRDGGS